MLDDIDYTEELVKENDYTVSQIRKGSSKKDGVHFNSRITRTFNFLSAQVSTQTRDITYQVAAYERAGSSSVATTLTTQNFEDFQSKDEIRLMHEKLLRLKGKPPAIDDILEEDSKKKIRIPPPGASTGTRG